MSSDYEFDDFNDSILHEIDAIEARVTQNPPPVVDASPSRDGDDDDITFDIDVNELARLDDFIEASYNGTAQPVAGPSRMQQTTLTGEVLPLATASRPSGRTPFGRQPSKTKKWDHTRYLKSGNRRKTNGRRAAAEEEEDDVEFEQFPAPFVTPGYVFPFVPFAPPPMKLKPDLLEAKHWVYPLNHPKRDYQFNIVQHCLFENTIVALPTGLGKTFVAGVVMLNFYRWFPEGKVVFVAPTKPLVSQQIEACHKTCGIPGTDAVELTGETPAAQRARAWGSKRVVYMTPQTLFNDLEKENCDCKDIVLIVIDEAHRATGDYAYTKVVRYMMAKNPHFRVLALTATPGSTPEAVQELCDNLHISRIEIRNDESLDIRPYIHQKKVESHVISMSDEVNRIKVLLQKLMESFFPSLRGQGIPAGAPFNAITMSPFYPQQLARDLHPGQRGAFWPLQYLSKLARAMGYLLEGTIGMCNTYLQTIVANEPDEDGNKPKSNKALVEKPLFKELMKEVNTQQAGGFSMHPKMETLKRIVIDHFGKNMNDEAGPTKAMIFLQFREGVEEVVRILNEQRPLIRAHAFIGQGKDRKGVKGLTQKEQLAVIQRFKDDEFNVLVATSIGEEGLDIGEVDLIVCYDTQKTPIRMLQRFGRTGRKRNGAIHALLSEGREEGSIDKAKDKQRLVHGAIVRGDQLELYGDVERLLPSHIHPQCLEKKMEIHEYVREERKKRTSSRDQSGPSKGKKRKRNDDPSRNIPSGALTGFLSASKLRVKDKGKETGREPDPEPELKRPKVKDTRTLEERGLDDDLDRELEEDVGGFIGLARRSVSAAASTSAPSEKGVPLRRAATDGTSKKKVLTGKSASTSSQIRPSILPSKERDISIIDIADSDDSGKHVGSANSPCADVGWLLDDEDDALDIEIVDSSPPPPKPEAPPLKAYTGFISAKAAGKRRASTPDTSLEVIVASPPTKKARADMPPPRVPQHALSPPAPSFPVRRPGRVVRPATRMEAVDVSPEMQSPKLQRRLHRRGAHVNPSDNKGRNNERRLLRPMYDMEATHSGDEVSEGSSGSNDEESESDRQFLKDIPDTQPSPSYDQSLVYRQSLLTQVPGRGPQFSRPLVRNGRFGGGLSEPARLPYRVALSSSPVRDDSEPDEYAFGSFVVADEEIIFASSEG
ncbi:hypothetical protein MKEN_00806500 [Mycena kentingensis (nom. inval.)]|nr:hypothetical protein MKEN_00806500 [Mycena kentingensis (nom. inval.)]